jgi:release factor glutamine methyltransferase
MSASAWTVGRTLSEARARGVDRLDAQLLLAHALDRPRAWLLAHDDAALDSSQAQVVRDAISRRAAGEPLAYLIGEREFHGLALRVNPAVLVPRPETELLVDWALELLARRQAASSSPRVVDLGTGSGAIAIAVKWGCPAADVVATDISSAALDVAAQNAGRIGVELTLLQGSWWSASALAERRFELVLANPPYIAADDVHLSALRHEPALALTPGGDGLGALRQIIDQAAEHLAPGGWILLEHGYDQAEAVRALLRGRGLRQIETRRDLAGQPRCTGACG